MKKRLPELQFGLLPAELINRTIGTELEPGIVVMSAAAQRHAGSSKDKQRQADYSRCLPHLASIINDPTYIGDDLKNSGIELIGQISTTIGFVLVAINVQKDTKGRYNICSFYIVSRTKITNRRTKGFLKLAARK